MSMHESRTAKVKLVPFRGEVWPRQRPTHFGADSFISSQPPALIQRFIPFASTSLTLRPLHEGAELRLGRWRSSKTRWKRIMFRHNPKVFGLTKYLRDLRDLLTELRVCATLTEYRPRTLVAKCIGTPLTKVPPFCNPTPPCGKVLGYPVLLYEELWYWQPAGLLLLLGSIVDSVKLCARLAAGEYAMWIDKIMSVDHVKNTPSLLANFSSQHEHWQRGQTYNVGSCKTEFSRQHDHQHVGG